MKAPKLGLAAAVVVALVMSGCSSGTDEDDGDGGGSGGSNENADLKLCMYTHGDGGGFWSVAKKGAEKAADDLGVDLDYQESDNDPEAQAQLIEAGVDGGCDGIAVSAPNPDAIQGGMDKANDAGIPLVTMNSGSDAFQDLHAFTHVGQDEFIAGQEAGRRFEELGATKILCPIQEASNIGLQQRCEGAADTFGSVENLQLSAGLDDLSRSEAEIQAQLEADPSIDAVFALNADIATGSAMPAAEAVGRELIIGTVDLSGDAVQAIADGDMAFAIDQQQFAQGYLPIVLLYLNKTNGHVLGGGLPMYTGPGFVTQENAEQVQQLAEEGTR